MRSLLQTTGVILAILLASVAIALVSVYFMGNYHLASPTKNRHVYASAYAFDTTFYRVERADNGFVSYTNLSNGFTHVTREKYFRSSLIGEYDSITNKIVNTGGVGNYLKALKIQ